MFVVVLVEKYPFMLGDCDLTTWQLQGLRLSLFFCFHETCIRNDEDTAVISNIIK